VLSSNEDGDVIVTSVVENSVADVTGFKTGDKVIAVQNENVTVTAHRLNRMGFSVRTTA
jgi:C-terminal processing protease CtpA/Prc